MHARRPRVEGEREDEILDAAVELLLETGYDRLTMDAVAKHARASKATLYRRWESKSALVIDALVRHRPHDTPAGAPDTGTLRGDLIATFCGVAGSAVRETTRVMAAVLTAMHSDDDFAERFREQFIAPKVAHTRQVYARAIERGEISPDVDLDVVGPALAGVLMHRSFVLGIPPDDDTVARVVDHLILPALTHGAGSSPAPSSPSGS